jgi:tRNA (guanine37-N1)-methyltransferase
MLELAGPKKRVDSPVVGHGSGMLLGTEIIEKAYNKALSFHDIKPFTIFFSPHGKILDQRVLELLHQKIKDRGNNVLLYAGRYEGYDVRAEEEYADEIISIGNYVLMGGDLPAMVFIESILRLIPGVIGKENSVLQDSFQSPYLDYPHYAQPQEWHGKEIPVILKSGNHKALLEWRSEEARKRTMLRNFQWWRESEVPLLERKACKKHIPHHYAVLLHNDVMVPGNNPGEPNKSSESSVTSIDIHDISRSCATYGIKNYFVVTRLLAQQKLVEIFLSFWHDDRGQEYNANRAFALNNTFLKTELSEVIAEVKKLEGIEPLLIVTSSRREIEHKNFITFHDQEKIWSQGRPIIFVFGTAHGINPKIMNQCDYRLIPLEGMEEFNFLSVRSAAAIVFDRWLGMNQKI